MKHQINAAKLGNQLAFNSLYEFYWKRVYAFMIKRTNNDTISRDITHETLVRAFIRINSYKPKYEFSTWLIAIAKNLHNNLLKKNQKLYFELSNDYFFIADTMPTPEDELIDKENSLQLLKSINKLNPIHKEVFLLRDEGFTYDEIVDRTGDKIGNVKAKLSRARVRLIYLVQ
jgi:RNA polymerase sigma-70 factor (ECF subfamily)